MDTKLQASKIITKALSRVLEGEDTGGDKDRMAVFLLHPGLQETSLLDGSVDGDRIVPSLETRSKDEKACAKQVSLA